ncbi:MAG: hypothetical protein HY810_09745 [Candidatus Omnitrophica bacterium]|nr:hypothetical protein [Candidatus Omnitrophota bacterium]
MLDRKLKSCIESAVNFQDVGHVPICDFLDNQKLFNYFFPERKISLNEKIEVYHKLGIDICWQFERRQKIRKNGFFENLCKHILRNPSYCVLTKEAVIEEFDDFEEQQKMFAPYTYLAMSADGCLGIVHRNLGFEAFNKKMYEDPIEIDKLIEIFAENLFQRADEFSRRKLGDLFFIKEDIAYEKGLIFSINFLKSHWLNRIKDAISPLKQAGIKVVLHSEGNIEPILDELIDIGIDGIHPLDRKAGMDAVLLKKTYAKSLLLLGSIEIEDADAGAIIEQTKNCLKNAAFGGGFFIGSCSGIISNLNLNKIFAFFNAIKDIQNTP